MHDVPTLVEFTTDPQLLGLALSPAQETCLRAIQGLPLDDAQRELFRACTGRECPPTERVPEATIIAGARAGKDSRIAAPVIAYEAIFGGHERELGKGERGVLVLVAQDLRGIRVAFGYLRDYLTGSPLLSRMVEEVLTLELRLTNGLTILCFPCTQRSLRGFSIPAAVLDELAFFRLEGQADADVEIQASIRRGMLAFPAPRLVKISTPYMRSGVLFDDFKRAWGQDDPDCLVWRAPTTLMNPMITAERLERERRLDPQRFSREYEAEFAEDLEAFLPGVWIEDAVSRGSYERPPQDGAAYIAACDPSGGGADAFTLAIVHAEGTGAERCVVQDAMKSWARIGSQAPDLTAVVREIASTVKRYRLHEITGDRYAGQWVRQAFQQAGVTYREAPMDKARAYLEVEPLFAQGRITILDHPALVRELKILERRPRVGGRTLVDHPHGGHDDHANALALAAALALQGPPTTIPLAFFGDAPDPKTEEQELALERRQARELWFGDRGWTPIG